MSSSAYIVDAVRTAGGSRQAHPENRLTVSAPYPRTGTESCAQGASDQADIKAQFTAISAALDGQDLESSSRQRQVLLRAL
jgi:hypothetical protein